MSLPYARNLIGGQWTDGHAVRDAHAPATGQLIGTFADAGAVTARAAIDAARRAFRETGGARDRELRARALHEMADRHDAGPHSLTGRPGGGSNRPRAAEGPKA
ncbi:hypothetical protein [Streptomyces sp. NPDC056987]|uniref:hypothetical protein n=1 Tax=Streptomyces sp. NPDC056987 TaxID=3345988 RepID=UPI003634D405